MKNRSLSARFLRTAPAVLCAALMVTGLAGCVHVTVNTTDDASDTEEQLIADDDPMETDSIDQVPDIMGGGGSDAVSAEFYASTDYYKVTMPTEWIDRTAVEEIDGAPAAERGAEDIVSFYSTACWEAGEGGHIATIVLSEELPEALEMIPGEVIGVLTEEASGRTLNAWIEYPSDVQSGPDTMDEYAELSEGRGSLAETFEPAEGWSLERMTFDEIMAE